jgi:hypothetical protein
MFFILKKLIVTSTHQNNIKTLKILILKKKYISNFFKIKKQTYPVC